MIRRKQPIKRSPAPRRRSRVKRSNPARRKDTFARCFHSKARVRFVKSLPCQACNVEGYSDNAHIPGAEGSGAGRRGNYDQIIPLCHTTRGVEGCHNLLHRAPASFALWYPTLAVNFKLAAKFCEASWRAHHAGEP